MSRALPIRGFAVTALVGVVVFAAVSARAQHDAAVTASPPSSDAGTDASVGGWYDLAPMTPLERREHPLLIGAFRAADARSPVAGVRFSPSPTDRRQGRLWVLWRRPLARGAARFDEGDYAMDHS